MKTKIETLRQRDADEAARLHRRPRSSYLAELDRLYAAQRDRALAAGVAPGAPGGLLDAIAAELAALTSAQSLRPRLAAALAKYPAVSPSDAPVLADALRTYRGIAEGALSVLDANSGQLETWRQKIEEVPEDCGSPTALAGDHFVRILPWLDRARGVPAALGELDGLGRDLEALADALLARAARVELPVGVALPPEPPPAPRRSKTTEILHG